MLFCKDVRHGPSVREKMSMYEYRVGRRIVGLKSGGLHEIGVNCIMRKLNENEVSCIKREEGA